MGVLLLLVGLGVLGFGFMQHLKGKRILAAPFKKTGELQKNPVSEDPKGAMSTEGKVLAPAQQLLSPCSKQPCLYYEVKIERIYEKTETTQDGTKTVKGTETLDTVKGGAVFGVDDGSGAIQVDVSKGADFDNMKDGYKKELNGRSWASNIQFGEFSYDLPPISSGESWTIGFKATEKYVPVEGNLFVLGKLEGGKLVKPGWRSMMASNKGREGLLGSIQKKKKFSFIGGGIAAVLSIPAFIFAPAPDPNAVSAYCESTLTDARQKCSDTVSSKSGEEYSWTVTKPGEYELEVFAPAKKVAFDPQLIVKNAAGEELANVEGGIGANAKAKLNAQAGTYTVIVKPGDDYMVKGGFSFDMEIRSLSAPAAGGEGAAAAAPAVAKGELIKLDAPALSAEFLKDAKSIAKYDGQQLEVKGVLASVETDEDRMDGEDTSYRVVVFNTPMPEKFGVLAQLKPEAKVKEDQFVSIRGTAKFDDIANALVLENAELVTAGSNTALAPKAGPAPKAAPKAKKGKK